MKFIRGVESGDYFDLNGCLLNLSLLILYLVVMGTNKVGNVWNVWNILVKIIFKMWFVFRDFIII